MTAPVFVALTASRILDADAQGELLANINAIEAMFLARKISVCDVARMLGDAATKAEKETERRRWAREAS